MSEVGLLMTNAFQSSSVSASVSVLLLSRFCLPGCGYYVRSWSSTDRRPSELFYLGFCLCLASVLLLSPWLWVLCPKLVFYWPTSFRALLSRLLSLSRFCLASVSLIVGIMSEVGLLLTDVLQSSSVSASVSVSLLSSFLRHDVFYTSAIPEIT